MADHTLNTTVSRRTMLAGGVAVLAAPVPTLAISPATGHWGFDGQCLDASLLWRIAAAHDYLAAYRRADALCTHLDQVLSGHPDFPGHMPCTQAERDEWDALLDRAGITTADAQCERLYEHYEAALAAAFSLPARTLAGVYGKLRLAVTAVKQEHSAVLDAADCTYLDNTLGDLQRLAAR